MAGLKLTPEVLRATYDFLREMPPFKAWHLPTEGVKFVVSKTRHNYGMCAAWDDGTFTISVSSGMVGLTNTLLITMAHEMLHLAQSVQKVETPNTEHNADFWRRARRVCAVHGFDPKSF